MTTTSVAPDFPLAALVGQERLKSALLLCAVNPGVGGVLIRGEKGSAKSTAARGLAGVMPPIERVVGCAYNCAPGEPSVACEVCNGELRSLETTVVPFVNLPLGASEDRVLGSLDFERALKDGRKAFQPGLLACAHRGILYIDEVNLLPDHLVDVLLDVAAMGVNRVQREGLSVQHAARIALVGTMNQEEGELRPQLLDRFGMMVEVRAPLEPRVRTEIVKRRLEWEADPEGFARAWSARQVALGEQVLRARELLPEVSIAEGLLVLISELCCSQGVASLRADLVMNKAARALAALGGRTRVEPDDISEAAMLVLPHRRRTKPFEEPGLDEEQLQRMMQKAAAAASGEGQSDDDSRPGSRRASPRHQDSVSEDGQGGSSQKESGGGRQNDEARQGDDRVFAPGVAASAPRIDLKSGAVAMGVVGRRSSVAQARRGSVVRAVPDERPTELAVTATLQHSVLRTGGLAADGRLEVTRADLHQNVKAGRQGSSILFVVDASGSMAALQRMEAVKGTVIALLRDAYQRRDEVGVIAFRGTEAKLLLPLTRSVDAAERQLRELATGGRTPLAHALQLAGDVLTRASGVSHGDPLLIILSDGHANVSLDVGADSHGREAIEQGTRPESPLLQQQLGANEPWQQALECARRLAEKGLAALVFDTEVGFVRMGRAQELAAALDARCLALEELTTDTLTVTVRSRLHGMGRRRPGHNA
ncbi:MAG TPA: magnesium chelatase subunit D family protein [Steroidobacteraceae bacterium]